MGKIPQRVKASVLMLLILFFGDAGISSGAEDDFARYEAGFKNFLTCELTRTDAKSHFKGKAFTISMINLHEVTEESGTIILTGAVQCFVEDRYKTLYPAVGVTRVAGREKVSYYIIRTQDFSILGSELIRYPYKERCPWARYWIDTD